MPDQSDENFPLQPLADCSVSVSLKELASRIRASSNFRFAWQWFRAPEARSGDQRAALAILDAVTQRPACHEFLRAEGGSDGHEFEIAPVHQHMRLRAADGAAEAVLAAAAADQLGVYSPVSRPATPAQTAAVTRLFSELGRYSIFELEQITPGPCPRCEPPDIHLISSWFYGSCFDWCFCALWPEARVAWVGCLSDTD